MNPVLENRVGLQVLLLVLLLLKPVGLAAQDSYQKDLVLHYTFDQKSGGKVSNKEGGLHPGKPKEATFFAEKNSGKSLRVRKNNDRSGYVETPNHADFNTTNFTVAAWIKLEQTNSNGSVICKHDWHRGGARGFVLRCYDGERLNFTVGAGGWLAAVGKTKLAANKWVHAVGTYDGKKISVYYNGRLDGTKMTEAPYTPSSFPLRIGHAAFALDTHRKFDGRIDDVMIWKRTLSDAEILTVYEDQKDSRPPPLMDADVAELMAKLGSKSFQSRNQAQKKLIGFGTELLPLLDKYRKTDDLEINVRIEQIKKAIQTNPWR